MHIKAHVFSYFIVCDIVNCPTVLQYNSILYRILPHALIGNFGGGNGREVVDGTCWDKKIVFYHLNGSNLCRLAKFRIKKSKIPREKIPVYPLNVSYRMHTTITG